jgi:prepilin-type N-terminal cleavage/methylation domain-containing protein
MHMTLSHRRVRSGFTLIEMVVVLIIIATLAGIALPLVSMLGRSSDMTASAANDAELANNIQLFFVLQKRYPQGFDSLLDTTGALYAPDSTSEATQTRGLPVSGPSLYADLTVDTLGPDVSGTSEYYRSFARGGFDWLYDHDLAVINANNSGTVQRNLSSTGTKVAGVTAGSAVAKKLLPGTAGIPQANTKLIAVGIGPNNTAIGKTIMQAPIYPGCDGKYYGRYIAFLQVFASGERAVLVGVTDSYGRSLDYSIQQFNESLPNGGRQG